MMNKRIAQTKRDILDRELKALEKIQDMIKNRILLINVAIIILNLEKEAE